MKRLLFVMLMMVCSVSWAEWELCSSGGEGDEKMLVYCDKSTIKRNGSISRIWELTNSSKARMDSLGNRFMSDKALMTYNCREEAVAIISLVLYSGLNGEGNVVWSGTRQEREYKWEPIVPGTHGENLWKIACGKK